MAINSNFSVYSWAVSSLVFNQLCTMAEKEFNEAHTVSQPRSTDPLMIHPKGFCPEVGNTLLRVGHKLWGSEHKVFPSWASEQGS